MAGLNGQRVYLDWNASAPLRPEARAAMLEAMDVVGNPSSVHAEGRAARAIVEKARGQVAALVGCARDEVVFTSGATEAANAVFSMPFTKIWSGAAEHDAVFFGELNGCGPTHHGLQVNVKRDGTPDYGGFADPFEFAEHGDQGLHVLSAANSETGVVSDWERLREITSRLGTEWFCDATQAIGKVPFSTSTAGMTYASGSAHKLGGPRGAGCLRVGSHRFELWHIRGGGQEKGHRSGTENVIGIAGFGAAAEAAQRDLEAGVWDRVEKLRDNLEARLDTEASDLIIFGRGAPRLPNTSCFAVPGWAGETQVMQMDLAGFAISAGSACSSGKVKKASRVLMAMGFDEETASSAIRVSMGAVTTEAEVMAFADAWIDAYRRRKSRAA